MIIIRYKYTLAVIPAQNIDRYLTPGPVLSQNECIRQVYPHIRMLPMITGVLGIDAYVVKIIYESAKKISFSEDIFR